MFAAGGLETGSPQPLSKGVCIAGAGAGGLVKDEAEIWMGAGWAAAAGAGADAGVEEAHASLEPQASMLDMLEKFASGGELVCDCGGDACFAGTGGGAGWERLKAE